MIWIETISDKNFSRVAHLLNKCCVSGSVTWCNREAIALISKRRASRTDETNVVLVDVCLLPMRY